MGVCTVECNSGSCCHVFWWGFTYTFLHQCGQRWAFSTFSIEKLLFFQLLSATITASWSMGHCRSPRWAAGLLSRMYLWAQLYWSVLSLQLQVMQLLLVIHKVNCCKSMVTISAPITLINMLCTERTWTRLRFPVVFLVQGDIFENYCRNDNLATFGRFCYGVSIITTFPLECFVTREVR